jgi:hypothetical protein
MLLAGLTASVSAADSIATTDLPRTGRVLIVAGGDITVPQGEQADLLLVAAGDASVSGTVNALVMIDGTATLTGATVGTVVVVSGTVDVGPGTVVLNDVAEARGTVVSSGGEIMGSTRELATGIAVFGVFAGIVAIIVWVGVGVAALIAALVLSSLAGQQLRKAAWLIGHEPVPSILLGLLSIVVIPLVAVLAMVTVIGIPTGLGILLVMWPALAFLGYLVGAIWIGEWLLSRRAGYVPAERPHLAAVVGLVVAFVLGLIPLLSAIISIVGTGAVILAVWLTWRGRRPAGVPA